MRNLRWKFHLIFRLKMWIVCILDLWILWVVIIRKFISRTSFFLCLLFYHGLVGFQWCHCDGSVVILFLPFPGFILGSNDRARIFFVRYNRYSMTHTGFCGIFKSMLIFLPSYFSCYILFYIYIYLQIWTHVSQLRLFLIKPFWLRISRYILICSYFFMQ